MPSRFAGSVATPVRFLRGRAAIDDGPAAGTSR